MSRDDTSAAADPSAGEGTYNNVAQDDSQVTMQVGVMHGDVHNLYQMTEDTPAEKVRVGCNYLKGNAQQRAEQLIGDAFMRGYRNARVAYYWALAVLSGRSFDHLDQRDFASLSLSFQFVDEDGGGQWCCALAVVSRLMRCLAEQDSKGDADPVQFAEVMIDFDALPDERREEIRSHLEMILDGGMQDHLDAQYALQMSSQRMGGDRKYRAWKFFEPDPVPPLRRWPRPVEIDAFAWVKLAGGVVLTATALALLLPLLVRRGPLPVAIPLVMCGFGGAVALRMRWEQRRREHRLETRRAARAPLPDEPRGKRSQERSFLSEVRKLVDAEFRYYRPRYDAAARKHWDADSAAVKNALVREIVDTYEGHGDLDPAKWLVRWYTREFVRQWHSGTLPDHGPEPDTPALASFGIAVGTASAVVGVGIALAVAFPVSWISTFWAACALALGCVPLVSGGTAVYLEYRRHADDLKEMTERFEEHTAAYEQMLAVLADRPTDSEMAQWLDRDKAHVRMLAMRHYRLSNREVFAHTVLCESTGYCPRRARVVYGPPRYSVYRVLVFLLTGSGVRQFSVTVDFATGLVSNENRFTFRYDAIASAGVTQRSVRIDSLRVTGAGSVPPHDTAEPARRRPNADQDTLVFARSFRLALVNNDVFGVRVENFDEGLRDRVREDPRTLLDLALDSSGITAALHILEAVAAEGKDWIARELKRRARRFDTYQENLGPRRPPPRPGSANGHRPRIVPAHPAGG